MKGNLEELNLPVDYETLSPEGQKQARIAGVLRQGPTPDDFVRAWVLFRTYYLRQLPPGVFYKEYAESPPFHFDLVRDIAQFRLNAWACPRGSAKSTILGTEIPLMMVLTRPHFDLLLILAKEEKVQRRLGQIMYQIETNPYILEDFGPMRPPRGSRIWNRSTLQLLNGSSLVGMPVEGKMLGERPDLVLCDDPEHDKALNKDPNPTYLREAFERLLYGIIMPMLMRGSGLGWIGTLLDARSFLHSFIHSREPHIEKFWNRRCLEIWKPDGTSLWEARWSEENLKDLQESMPDEYFQTHFMNKPGSSRGGLLKIHPQFCTYRVEPEQDWGEADPLRSTSELVTHRAIRVGGDEEAGIDGDAKYAMEEVRRPFGATVQNMRRLITVDFGFSTKASADYTAIHVLGYENNESFSDTLWCLDLWLGHLKFARVIPILWQYAVKWKVTMIAAEAIAHQSQLLDPIREFVEKQRGGEWDWAPLVVPVKYPAGIHKAGRISALAWKFDRFRVKLPSQRRLTWPYRELFHEITMFDESMRGMRHDDALDALAQFQFIATGKPRTGPPEPGEKRRDPVKEIEEGRLLSPEGIPYLSVLHPSQYPAEKIRQLAYEEREEQEREAGGGITWKTA